MISKFVYKISKVSVNICLMSTKTNKWENTNFLITSKRCIDSMLYISKNMPALSNLNLREKTDQLRRTFYIYLVNLLDEELKYCDKTTRKNIKEKDSIINKIYHERDKKSAHYDKNYTPLKLYNSLNDEINDKKIELEYVRNYCSDILPEIITLDYVPHDRELFRIVNRVNADYENKIEKQKHPFAELYQGDEFGGVKLKPVSDELTLLQSVDDVKFIPQEQKEKYGVLLDAGINTYEGIQNRQDMCIKMNALHNTNIWCSANKKNLEQLEEIKKTGLFDEFEIPHLELLKDKKILEKLKRIKNKP